MKKAASYKGSGVDIDAANEFIEKIKPIAKTTTRDGVMAPLGGFGALFDLKAAGFKDPILVTGVDGVGSKCAEAAKRGYHRSIGIDLVAMCANDVICHGARPLFFLDYLAMGKLDQERGAQIVQGIADGCIRAGCSLVGGETAELPIMYSEKEFELAGTCVGAVERKKLLPKKIKAGDQIIGLASNGLHANGFSMITKDFQDPERIKQVMAPTINYARSCLAIMDKLKGLAHITGGGITENVPRIIPDGLRASIHVNWELPELFKWIMGGEGLPLGHLEHLRKHVTQEEMLRTFNCGIGMVLIYDKKHETAIWKRLHSFGEKPYIIGKVQKSKNGEKIELFGEFK